MLRAIGIYLKIGLLRMGLSLLGLFLLVAKSLISLMSGIAHFIESQLTQLDQQNLEKEKIDE